MDVRASGRNSARKTMQKVPFVRETGKNSTRGLSFLLFDSELLIFPAVTGRSTVKRVREFAQSKDSLSSKYPLRVFLGNASDVERQPTKVFNVQTWARKSDAMPSTVNLQ